MTVWREGRGSGWERRSYQRDEGARVDEEAKVHKWEADG